MKRICFRLEHPEYVMGGASIQAYNIAKELKNNFVIHYICSNVRHFSRVSSGVLDDRNEWHQIHQYNLRKLGRASFLNYFELHRLLNRINPDLIYQRGLHSHAGIIAKWAKKNDKRYVWGLSSDRNCAFNSILDLNKNFLSWPIKCINCFLEIYGVMNADLIIAQTYHQAKLLKENFNKNSVVIPNGHAVPREPFSKSYPPLVIWMANIKPLKRPELFVRLANELDNLNARFMMIGKPGNNRYQKILNQMIMRSPNLGYLGEVSLEEANRLLDVASVFVNTSLPQEGFPNTCIQAWMRETPVVTLNVDPDNILEENKIGFHSRSFDKMVNDVKYLIANREVRRDIGKKARQYAIDNHDIKKIGKKYLEAFEKLIPK